ncbi:MAG: alanine--glyoxylate aminotransferase family protein [Anaerolineae bacterium]|nr:alanine--glyoxylate aminotransferase family protein [Anaerolineae bacterium]MDQ7035968.1 alanine--glyoxylate aminotransferase family protein [Anaerolineae bacterium]
MVKSNYPSIDVAPRVLLGPGPSLVDPRVLKAMATPLIGHLDPQFLDLMNKMQEMLRRVMQTDNQLTFAVAGTGSASMEASFANMLEPDDSILICINGYFGHRMVDMAERYGAKIHTISRPWGQVFTAEEVESALKANPAKVVAIVHAETSTGAMQPLDEIAKVVHAHDAYLIVDAVTSLGGVPVRVDEVGIDVCYSGAQKALSCPPGISPITFSDRAVEHIKSRKTKVANWYLDATMLGNYWGSERSYHHTAPISMNYALYETLRVILEEGLEARWQRHRETAALLWDGLEALDMSLHVEADYRLPTLTTVRIPSSIDEAVIRQALLHDYNIEIGGGLGELKGRVWRIGLMGYGSRKENVVLLLAAIERLMK